jgi:hypothetical protein
VHHETPALKEVLDRECEVVPPVFDLHYSMNDFCMNDHSIGMRDADHVFLSVFYDFHVNPQALRHSIFYDFFLCFEFG